jgi:tRNA (Thr-GGU) A37 N-methylase
VDVPDVDGDGRIRVAGLEAVDGAPVLDLKSLPRSPEQDRPAPTSGRTVDHPGGHAQPSRTARPTETQAHGRLTAGPGR